MKNKNNLFILRKNNNLSQSDIATILGVTRQAYSRYERGDREPDQSTLKKLADYFGVSIDYILERESPKNETQTTAQEEQFLKAFRQLSKGKQERIIELIEDMLKAEQSQRFKKTI